MEELIHTEKGRFNQVAENRKRIIRTKQGYLKQTIMWH